MEREICSCSQNFDPPLLPSCLPKIGVVVDLVEKIPTLAAAQANQRCKPMGTRGTTLPVRRIRRNLRNIYPRDKKREELPPAQGHKGYKATPFLGKRRVSDKVFLRPFLRNSSRARSDFFGLSPTRLYSICKKERIELAK